MRHAGELGDRLEDPAVAGTAAEVAGEAALDLLVARRARPSRAARLTVSSIPGVQKPHCSAAWRVNASSSRSNSGRSASPSIVVTSRPSASAAR